MYIHENLVSLRSHFQLNLEEVATLTDLTRQTLSKYEKGLAMPPTNVAGRLALLYKVSLDVLLNHQLAKYSAKQFQQLMAAPDPTYRGRSLQVREVVHTVNEHNDELIDLVPIPAVMGYAQGGFESEEFIGKLPKFKLPLPWVKSGRSYRAFPTKGDSMLPIQDGSYVVGEYVQDWYTVKNGLGYIFVLRDDGIVFKKAVNELATQQRFELHSLNPQYQPYMVPAEEVREIWKYVMVMSDVFPDPEPTQEVLLAELRSLKQGQAEILKRLQ
ncbi:hypothetical protein GCM10027299_09800 [Larkinella ripae]